MDERLHPLTGDPKLIDVLSPGGIRREAARALAPRLPSLTDAVVALVSNSKKGAEPILEGIREGLAELGVGEFRLLPKALASRAHPDLDKVTASCSAAVVALAD